MNINGLIGEKIPSNKAVAVKQKQNSGVNESKAMFQCKIRDIDTSDSIGY
jgi:hypothetical protein